MTSSSSQGCSKDEAPSGRVSKQYTKESLSQLRKRCASRVVGKEVVGRRIKIWWPLDKKFYAGKILCFDDEYRLHQIDYDDGEMEFLDLRRECWKLLKDGDSSAHKQKQEIGTDPASSSGAKQSSPVMIQADRTAPNKIIVYSRRKKKSAVAF